jgi:hypothetical protein
VAVGKRFNMRSALIVVVLFEGAVAGFAQTPVALDLDGKLRFHAQRTLGLTSAGTSVVSGAFLQMMDSPTEWGQGASGYGSRVASSAASSGVRSFLALGLDSTLNQDPRYFRSVSTGFWRRAAHAMRGTILTRTDGGGETLATSRLGSAFGAAFISNQWYPDRLNTVRCGFTDGSARLGVDLVRNLASEFWPDLKKKISRRKTQNLYREDR